MRYFLVIILIIQVLIITGCETPQGGSSLPWSKPEPWETQILPTLEE